MKLIHVRRSQHRAQQPIGSPLTKTACNPPVTSFTSATPRNTLDSTCAHLSNHLGIVLPDTLIERAKASLSRLYVDLERVGAPNLALSSAVCMDC